jgi:hypothetical protein
MFGGSEMAQSAKFTAVYEDTDNIEIIRTEACASTDGADYCDATGSSTSLSVLKGFATIRVPQNKELLVGLSAQVGLGTFTEAKGKKGTRSIATAFAEGGVTLFACEAENTTVCYEGRPGYVTLSNRMQQLEAVLGGVIESCDVEVLVDFDLKTASGSFTLADCAVLDEAISLGLTTLASHHFNFVFPDMPQGDFDIIAKFQTEASATAEAYCEYTYPGTEEEPDLLGCLDEMGTANATAYAYIGKWMMTVQTVRAVKDEDVRGGVIDITEPTEP